MSGKSQVQSPWRIGPIPARELPQRDGRGRQFIANIDSSVMLLDSVVKFTLEDRDGRPSFVIENRRNYRGRGGDGVELP